MGSLKFKTNNNRKNIHKKRKEKHTVKLTDRRKGKQNKINMVIAITAIGQALDIYWIVVYKP